MSSATDYSATFNGPEEIEQGKDNILTCPVYLNGAVVTPSAGTITVYDNTDAALVSGAAVTIPSTTAQYTLTSATLANSTPSDGWRIEWTLTIGVALYTFTQWGALVYRRLYPVVTDADLLRFHNDLTARRPPNRTSYQYEIGRAHV